MTSVAQLATRYLVPGRWISPSYGLPIHRLWSGSRWFCVWSSMTGVVQRARSGRGVLTFKEKGEVVGEAVLGQVGSEWQQTWKLQAVSHNIGCVSAASWTIRTGITSWWSVARSVSKMRRGSIEPRHWEKSNDSYPLLLTSSVSRGRAR